MKYTLALAPALLLALPAYASVGKISSPEVEKSVAEIEYSGTRYGDGSPALNNQQSHVYELEYGFTDRLKLGVELKSARTAARGSYYKASGIEGQYELTKQGDWWLSSAVKGEFTHAAHDRDADELETKLIAAYARGNTRILGNLGLEREVGNNRDHGVGLNSILQARYKMNEHAAPGIEWHADWGNINALSRTTNNEHYVGPVISGEFAELLGHELEYTLGYYWGLSDNTANHAIRLQLGYEFGF